MPLCPIMPGCDEVMKPTCWWCTAAFWNRPGSTRLAGTVCEATPGAAGYHVRRAV
jgi:hypothetical protein